MTGENPFIKKEYYVKESQPWANCDVVVSKGQTVSTISKVSVIGVTPMNILELENYLSIQIIQFLKMINLAQECDSYAIAGASIPSTCTNTFDTNFSTPYTQQFGGNANAATLKSFKYKPAYINSQTLNAKKHLCQQIEDIKSLLDDFNGILSAISQEDKNKYSDKLDDLQNKKNQNQQLRDLLDKKLDQIYSAETRHTDSLVMLDATVYTSVLWTILATSIIYFMFKKM